MPTETLFTFFKLPLNRALSKNRAKKLKSWGKGRNRKMQIGLCDTYKAAKLEVYYECLKASRGMRWKKQKIWLTIRVFKPNHRLDAINFLDGIADGVKDAIGVDDRYYSATVDWDIDKDNPRIEVFIRQWIQSVKI